MGMYYLQGNFDTVEIAEWYQQSSVQTGLGDTGLL